jgi:replicative superfamily II helicase
MEAQGLLSRDGEDRLQLTALGRACGESSLALESAVRLIELVRRPWAARLTAGRLMAIVQSLPEMDRQYTPLFRRGQGEVKWPREAAAIFGDDIVRVMQERAADLHTYYARAKRAAMLDAWTSGVPTSDIEKRFTHNPFNSVGAGDIRAAADLTRFHLRSAAILTQIAIPTLAPDDSATERLLRQLETGLPEAALQLLTLGVVLTRGEYLALTAAGLRTPQHVREADEDSLAAIIGAARLQQLNLAMPPAVGAAARAQLA